MNAIFEHPLFIPVVLSLVLVAVFPVFVGYLTLIERKVLADMQTRLGPMRVGPHGLLQPLADALKLMLKEDTTPTHADHFLFWLAPIVSVLAALIALAVLPFNSVLVIADVNVGLLVISAMGALGVLGIVLGGWSSNSHYPLLGALRSAAQLISYEVALGLALLAGVMSAGTLSLVEMVHVQQQRHLWLVFDNWGLMIFAFALFFIAAVAETNRAPFDLPEAESELVSGYHTEYSGMRFALFMLAEYANIFVISSVGVTLFWGGWLRPFPNVSWLELPFNFALPFVLLLLIAAGCFRMASREFVAGFRMLLLVIAGVCAVAALLFLLPAANHALAGLFWFFLKISVLIYVFMWFRGTFPRLRYDQLMSLGWKLLIPVGLALVGLNAVLGVL